MDDFGIKYYSKDDDQHLINAIGRNYQYTTDWTRRSYCGLTLDWNYPAGYIDMSMPGYLEKYLKRLQDKQRVTPQYSPHTHIPIKYAIKNTRKYATSPDTSPLLDPKETKYIQSVTGSLLYYERALYFTILPALNEVASEQVNPREKN